MRIRLEPRGHGDLGRHGDGEGGACPALPEETDKTTWEMFEAERPYLIPYVGRFDGFQSAPASVLKTCTVRFDNSKYSVLATAVGILVDLHAYAERVVIRQGGEVVGEHTHASGGARRSMTHGTMCLFWHANPARAAQWGSIQGLGASARHGRDPT